MITDTDLADVAIYFQQCWDAAKRADEAHRRAAHKHGDCVRTEKINDSDSCRHTNQPMKKWCKACRARQPFWLAKRAARHTATGAMRALLNAARKVES